MAYSESAEEHQHLSDSSFKRVVSIKMHSTIGISILVRESTEVPFRGPVYVSILTWPRNIVRRSLIRLVVFLSYHGRASARRSRYTTWSSANVSIPFPMLTTPPTPGSCWHDPWNRPSVR